MRLAGWFAAANAVLVGRTAAPGHEDLSQHGAVLDALGGLGVPLVADVECGHVAPHLALVRRRLRRAGLVAGGHVAHAVADLTRLGCTHGE